MYSVFLPKSLRLLPSVRRIGGASMKQHHFLKNITPFVIRCFSSSKQHPFTVSYLINSCGLSPETAVSASKKVQFETHKKPDSVLALLRNHGCTDIHISKIVAKYPPVLVAKPEKTLLPKLQFLASAGLPHEDLPKVLVSMPSLLRTSLEMNLIPTHNTLKGVVIGEENAIKALTKQRWMSRECAVKTIAPNAKLLRELGVPVAHISYLVTNYPTLCTKSGKFICMMDKVVAMGFDPQKLLFVSALQVLCQMSKSTWEQKIAVYRRFGLSEDEIMLAFRSNPICLQLSEKKILSTMDYLVNMGWQPATIARTPAVLFFNLERRIVPRCSVVKLLLLKGLIKDLRLGTFLKATETTFMRKFIIKHKKKVPELLDLYHGKVNFQELGLVS